MKLVIVIPAYNEEGSIKEVLEKLPISLSGIKKIIPVVVDDGSEDKTFEIADACTKYVARHVVNLGVGAALTTGFAAAEKLNADIVVTLDGDGQHNPKDIQKLVNPIVEGKADIVIGTRMRNTSGMPAVKILGNWMMNVMTFVLFQKWSSDTQSGMRALSAKALKKLDLYSIGYEICSEMVGEAKRTKLKLEEVCIETIYTDYSKAKGQSISNAINIFTRLLTIKLSGKKK